LQTRFNIALESFYIMTKLVSFQWYKDCSIYTNTEQKHYNWQKSHDHLHWLRKIFDKIQPPLIIKALNNLGKIGTFLNIVKVICNEPIPNIIINVENLNPFPLKSEMRQEGSFPPLLLNMVLEFLATAIRQEKEINCIQIGNEEGNYPIYRL
jgi:hypothetical protein